MRLREDRLAGNRELLSTQQPEDKVAGRLVESSSLAPLSPSEPGRARGGPATPKVAEMPYDPLTIANAFLDRAAARGETLSPMKLQKLVYYAHGWYLALNGEPLLDEPIHAWLYGPVVNSIFREFRRFGNRTITTRATVADVTPPTDPASGTANQTTNQDESPARDFDINSFLDRIWDIYGRYTASQLSNQTHEPGTPWSEVAARYPGGVPRRVIVPDDRIEAYFRNHLVPAAVDA